MNAVTSARATTTSVDGRPNLEKERYPVRIAVVGCGYWGPNIIRNFSEVPDSELRIICDKDASRFASFQRRYPSVVAVTEFDELLADPQIDAIAICTPIHTHFTLARAALEAGKHVLVEKPLTHSVATAQELVNMAHASGLTLMVDHTFVYNGAVQKIKSIIDSGELGDVLYFDSVRINLGLFQSDVNVLWDLAPHDLSIMEYLLQREPTWVSAVGSAHFGHLENLAYLTMKFDDALIAHLHINWLAPVKLRSTVIGGSKRMIVYDDLDPSEKVKVYDKGVTLIRDQAERERALISYRVGDMYAPQLERTEPLQKVCRAFVESIMNGSTPITDGEAGRRVVHVLEAAQLSMARNGERIML